MKKKYGKVEYDTEDSELLHKRTFGNYGDPAGYEEILFKTKSGKLFIYTNGGSESPCHGEEGIRRISSEKADEWLSSGN